MSLPALTSPLWSRRRTVRERIPVRYRHPIFAARRTSRRTALAAGASVVAAGLASAAAQDATPVPASSGTPAAADTTGDDVHFSSCRPLAPARWRRRRTKRACMTLVADHLPGETLYFSDRPERIVGMVSTARFLGEGRTDEGLGFTPANPPNAALVFGGSDDQPGDVAVVELIDPRYDPSSGQVTYELRVLADVEAIDLQLEEAPLTADDCSSGLCLGQSVHRRLWRRPDPVRESAKWRCVPSGRDLCLLLQHEPGLLRALCRGLDSGSTWTRTPNSATKRTRTRNVTTVAPRNISRHRTPASLPDPTPRATRVGASS